MIASVMATAASFLSEPEYTSLPDAFFTRMSGTLPPLRSVALIATGCPASRYPRTVFLRNATAFWLSTSPRAQSTVTVTFRRPEVPANAADISTQTQTMRKRCLLISFPFRMGQRFRRRRRTHGSPPRVSCSVCECTRRSARRDAAWPIRCGHPCPSAGQKRKTA